jgi:FkbM family methyltransferase
MRKTKMSVLLKKIRVALTPRRCLLKTTLSNGAIVYGKNRAGFGGRGIYIYGDAIEPEFQQLERFLCPEGVFIDVGANTGIYTLKAAKYFDQKGVVLAIEPFPDVLATLYYSVQANSFQNVRLRNFCASDKTGSGTLWLNAGHPNSFSLFKNDEKASSLSTLKVALDDLFEWENLSRLDYLKIDAEGAEQMILSGASKVIQKFRPIIQAEILLKQVSFALPDYSSFSAPASPNKLFIPKENPKHGLPVALGWHENH